MKKAYPIVITKLKEESGYLVYIPDFEVNTEGESIADAIEMARDAIGLLGIDLEDDNKGLPIPSDIDKICHSNSDILSLVDVDFAEYRRKNDMRTVKKNCTIPSWLNYKAEEAGINFSATLQTALKKELNIN